MKRLNSVLMTALSAGLAPIRLTLAGGEPGTEVRSAMAVVLNMLVVPALFLRYDVERPGTDASLPLRETEPVLEPASTAAQLLAIQTMLISPPEQRSIRFGERDIFAHQSRDAPFRSAC